MYYELDVFVNKKVICIDFRPELSNFDILQIGKNCQAAIQVLIFTHK